MHALPPELLSSLQNLPGFDEAAFKAAHESGAQITSVRVNPAKDFNVTEHFPGAEKVSWSCKGYYLPARPSFTIDPLFHAGAYYVQEASSMFLEEAMRQTLDLTQPLKVLDLCASPGGKSTLIQAVISQESLLVSNEVIKTRVNTLTDNIIKWGAPNTIVTNNDAKDFQRLEAFFDVIVADAPCSGSGLFRKDNEAISEWSVNSVELCSQRQKRILNDVLPALKDGGILIYSTCSYSESEDEGIADMLAENDMKNIRLNIEQFPGIIETVSEKHGCFGYRFYPDKIKGEGFFIAVFKKENGDLPPEKKKGKQEQLSKADQEFIQPYLKTAADFFFIKQHEEILAIPETLYAAFGEIKHSLYIKKAGVKLGSLIRNELIPAHDFAVSGIMSDIFPEINVTLEDALDYLRRKDISLTAEKKGWTVVKYKDHTLGFVKILPGRVNNYYPKELRILNK